MGGGVKSGTSLKQKGRSLEESRKSVVQKTTADILPSYGAQHRQGALWEGGDEVLPPGWQEYDIGNHTVRYQDDNLLMVTLKRPLPGIRLDFPGQLIVPGWEWHISPLGRSYFVNHNNRTTSWKKPMRERPPGSLTPKYVIKGHSQPIRSITCMGNSRGVISPSDDGSIRQWTRDGKAIGQPWRSDGWPVVSLTLSPDETMVVSGSGDGRIRLWDIKDGRIIGEPWEGHSHSLTCIDWSPNSQEVVSGSQDGTIRRWNPNGRQITPPIVGQGWWVDVKYSPQGDKFAACGPDHIIHVWSKDGKPLIEISQPGGYWVHSLCWATDGTCIFSGSADDNIRKWRLIDGEELIVLRGHTDTVLSLCLTLDECYLVSTSMDSSVRIWDLRTNKQVGEPLWHDDQVWTVAISPDRQCIASGGLDKKIYLWDFEAALKQSSSLDQNAHDNDLQSNVKERISSSRDILDVSTKPQPRLNNPSASKYGDNFWGIDPRHSPGDSAPLSSPSTTSSRHNFFDFLHFNFRPVHSSTQMTQRCRRWNVGLSLRKIPNRAVDVAAGHDFQRYGIPPPTEAEIAKAMQDDPCTTVNDAAHHDGYPPVQIPQQGAPVQIAQGRNAAADADADEQLHKIWCCGFHLVFGVRRPQ